MHDDDVGRIGLQCTPDAVRAYEVLRPDRLVSRCDRPDADPGASVKRLPVRLDRLWAVHHAEQDLDGVPHPGQREREVRRRGAHPADRQEAAQLMRDDRDSWQGAKSI